MNNKSALAAEVILKLLKLRKQAVFLTHLWSGFFMPYKGSEHVGIITLSVNAQVHAEMFSFCPNISYKFGLMKMKDFFRMIIPPSNVFFFSLLLLFSEKAFQLSNTMTSKKSGCQSENCFWKERIYPGRRIFFPLLQIEKETKNILIIKIIWIHFLRSARGKPECSATK